LSTENNLQPKNIVNYYTQFDIFTANECKKILQNVIDLRKTTFAFKLSKKFIRKGSSMKSQHLTLKEDTKWIFDRVTNKLSDTFNLKWLDTPECVFRCYSEGDYFLEHRDRVNTKKSFYNTKYFTVAVQLSYPSEYEGGDVVVDRKHTNSKSIGSASLWGSNLIHEVKEIKKGIRYSLCFFITSNDIFLKNRSFI
jgi:predicted 2-oxoglutarate/Fe(II)-dependent dioxygenase YbiX